jgi:hypothetical protein
LATPANLLAALQGTQEFQQVSVQILQSVDPRITPAG